MGEMEFGLFGTFSVWRDGRRLTDREIGARKARMLLKLLVVERGRPVTIDRAVEVLWGDAPPERAEENVATVVSRLRAALGADVVAGGRGGYQLTPTAAVDVDRVVSLLDEADARLVCGEAPLARAAVDQALTFVARGDLLCDEADTPWADEARRHAHALVRRARRVAWQAAFDLQDWRAARDMAEEAVAADDLDEEAHRAVMLAHYRAGEPGAALAAYSRLRDVLVERLGADPGAETEALYVAILRSEEPVGDRPSPPGRGADGRLRSPLRRPATGPGLVGRATETSRMEDAWAGAVEGRPAFVLLVGEAGIGKTRVAEEAARVAEGTGGFVVTSRCYEAERSLFLQPVVEAVRSIAVRLAPDALRDVVGEWAGTLGELVPEVNAVLRPLRYEAVGGELERRRAFEAVAAFFSRLTRRQPVLLVMDDIHQAGASTVELLHFLVRRLSRERLLVAATVRPDEGAEALEQLAPLGEVIDIGPLGADAVAELAASMGVAAVADRIMRLTGGHALYTLEALRAMVEAGAGEGDDVPVPASLRSAVVSRVRRTGVEVEELLRTAVVLGSAVDLADVAALLGISVEDAVRRAERARVAHLLVESGAAYDFVNDLVRDVLYETTPAPARVARHRAAMALVVGRPEALARHAAAAGEWTAAVTAAEEAAATAARAFANRDAERLLTEALAAAAHVDDPSAEARIRLLRGRAREQLADYRGAHDDHALALELARALHDPDLEANALERLGWTAYYARDGRGADDVAVRVVELAEAAAAAPASRPGGFLLASRMRQWRGDLGGAVDLAEEALAAATDPATVAHAHYTMGAVLCHGDRWQEARDFCARAAAGCERTGSFRILLSALFFEAIACAQLGDLSQALALLHRHRALLDEFEVPYYRPRTATTEAWVRLELGDVARAGDLVAEALELADRADDDIGASQLHERAHAHLAGAELALLRGDETMATAHLERVDALALLDLAFTWRWELRGIALRARMEPARADELRDLARARGCRKYEALALAALGRAEEAAAVARPLGSDLLLTHVAPVAEARAAAERVAARLPAELRKTYVLRAEA